MEAVDGEITVITNDGEKVTITITKESSEAEQTKDNEKEQTDEPQPKEEDESCKNDISDILPTISSIEDVFKVLGAWEDAHEWREHHIAWV